MSDLPKVLLLGDSIRGSYQPLVAEALAGKAEVVGPNENCQHAQHTRANLDRWLEELGRVDVVHWNNGIHDVGHKDGRTPRQFPLETYVENLRAILARLRETPAKIIWATTTPVNAEGPLEAKPWTWWNEQIDRYNAAALELMEGEGLPVNDLHAVVWADRERYMGEDKLHLSPQGQARCAEEVVKAVSACLSE